MEFVKTKHYNFLKKFFENKVHINLFVYGPKGTGKTQTIEAIHRDMDKPYFRVNISIETDEDSLIGGFRLINGDTVFDKGPVIKAMESGATLLLDEIDMGHPQRLMCLQSILEGSGYLIKRTNEFVRAKEGFKIIATANTKGYGDESGQYVGAQILNGAFKDRFSAFYEINYPSEEDEVEILQQINDHYKENYFPDATGDNVVSQQTIKNLVTWAHKVRNTHTNIDDESISIRKLIDIIKTNFFIGDLKESISLCLGGYPTDSKEGFIETFDIIIGDKEPEVSYKVWS